MDSLMMLSVKESMGRRQPYVISGVERRVDGGRQKMITNDAAPLQQLKKHTL